MKKIAILIFAICNISLTNGQTSESTISSIVVEHLKEFRATIGDEANVFLALEYDPSTITINEKNFFIQPTINAKKIFGDNNFFVKFLFIKKDGQDILKGINFRIRKKNSRKIELINMGNGKDYFLK